MHPIDLRHALFTFAAAATLGVAAPGCDQKGDSGEPVTVRAAAVTEAAPAESQVHRENDFGGPPSDVPRPAPGSLSPGPVPPALPPPAIMPASEHPGHFGDRRPPVAKPAPEAGSISPPPPVPAEYIAKQTEYLRQWNALEPTIAHLPIEKQEAQRAALKRSVLGR